MQAVRGGTSCLGRSREMKHFDTSKRPFFGKSSGGIISCIPLESPIFVLIRKDFTKRYGNGFCISRAFSIHFSTSRTSSEVAFP